MKWGTNMKMKVDDAYRKYFEHWTDRKKPTPLPDNILVWSNTRGIAIRDLIPLDSGEGYMIGSGGEWLKRPINGSDDVDVFQLVEPDALDEAQTVLQQIDMLTEHVYAFEPDEEDELMRMLLQVKRYLDKYYGRVIETDEDEG